MIGGRWWWILPGLIFVSGPYLRADEVTLDNGQKLIGRISKLDDLDLYLSVHFADASIPIRWTNVVALESSAPIRIELRDGKAYFANIKMNQDESVLILEPGSQTPIETTRDQLYALEERKGDLDGELGLSGTGSDGNAKAQSLRLYWDLYYRWETQDLQFKGESTYDSTEGETTGKSLYAQIRYDWRFGDPAFLFAAVEEHHDKFADIESRLISTVGVGTYLLNHPSFVFRSDVGVTYTISRLKIGEDSETPGYRASATLHWRLPFDLRLKDYATFYGNLKDSKDWQARNEIMLSREVFKGFHLNGGLTTTWDNAAAVGVNRRDDTYYFGVGYEF